MRYSLFCHVALFVSGAFCALTSSEGSGPVCFYIAPSGDDAFSGRRPVRTSGDGPFATLRRARDAIRQLKRSGAFPQKGVVVEISPGTYQCAGPLLFTEWDSGKPGAPVVYRAQSGEVRITGARRLPAFRRVSQRTVRARLDASVRDRVVEADLSSLGIEDFGSPGGGTCELFFNDAPMEIARWPNGKFVRMAGVLRTKPVDVRGTKGDKVGRFFYRGDRPKRWVGEADPWACGFWFWDWSDGRQRIASIDTEKRIITLAPPHHGYGYRKGQWYYVYNLLSELDQPGEWYLDRSAKKLYFLPPGPTSGARATMSVASELLHLEGASYIEFRGLILEGARGNAVSLSGGKAIRFVGCTIRNCGGRGVAIAGGEGHCVSGCDLYNLGRGGVSLRGGDRRTLRPAGHVAENNHIFNYSRWKLTYSAGISLGGVGNRASHNLIHHSPHQAIAFSGNDHTIEYNEIHSVCLQSRDSGAMYAGRNWTMRGTVIRYNYLHHITGFAGKGCVGVYLDDMYCGTRIFGNVFYRVTRAAFIGGGRDNVVENNLFVQCNPALHVDARAMGWAKYHTDRWVKEAREKGLHLGIRFVEPPYSTRYPPLLRILQDNPYAPAGNKILRNICFGGRWDEIEGKARPFLAFKDNLVGEDPGCVDLASQDFRLRDDSPAFRCGFKRIPFEKIGLYRSPDRASWPVVHRVEEPDPSPFLDSGH